MTSANLAFTLGRIREVLSQAPHDNWRLGCPRYIRGWPNISTLISALVEQAPNGDLQLVDDLGLELVTGVREGRLDLVLTLMPVDIPDLRTAIVGREPLTVALSAKHRLAPLAEIPPEDLRAEPFIIFPRALNPWLFDHYTAIFAQADVHPKIVEEPHREGTRAAVADGLGFALVAEPLAEQMPLHGVVHRRLAGMSPTIDVRLIWRDPSQ